MYEERAWPRAKAIFLVGGAHLQAQLLADQGGDQDVKGRPALLGGGRRRQALGSM